MTTKRRVRIKSLVCPECGEIGTLRRIIYGMPDPKSFDFENMRWVDVVFAGMVWILMCGASSASGKVSAKS